MSSKCPEPPGEYLTFPRTKREYGLGIRTLRRLAFTERAFPVYTFGTTWPRIKRSEFEAWIRSTRIPATDHASARVAEVIAREAAT